MLEERSLIAKGAPGCGKTFSLKKHLKYHTCDIHENKDQTSKVLKQCDICELPFSNLMRHIRSIHQSKEKRRADLRKLILLSANS